MKAIRELWFLPIFALISALSFWGAGDQQAQKWVEESSKRALIAFATARGLNGIISVAQGSYIAVQPGGLGVGIAAGEILDPVNDLVERFSWVMLMSASALGVQYLLLSVSGWWGFSVLLLLGGCFWFWSRLQRRRIRQMGNRLLMLLLVLRFALPFSIAASEWVYQQFFEQTYNEAASEVEATQARLMNMQMDPDAAQDPGFFDRLFGSEPLLPDLNDLASTAGELTEDIIKMIAVFMLQTLVLPIGFIWLLWRLLRIGFMPVGRPEH